MIPGSNIDPNIAYNYQKNPYLVKTNKDQVQAGFVLTQRNNTQANRNVNSLFPANFSTPNPAAGSPTALVNNGPRPINIEMYAGYQNIV